MIIYMSGYELIFQSDVKWNGLDSVTDAVTVTGSTQM